MISKIWAISCEWTIFLTDLIKHQFLLKANMFTNRPLNIPSELLTLSNRSAFSRFDVLPPSLLSFTKFSHFILKFWKLKTKLLIFRITVIWMVLMDVIIRPFVKLLPDGLTPQYFLGASMTWRQECSR